MAPIGPYDRAPLLAHLLRLGDEDRHLRFRRPVSDASMRAHVAGSDFVVPTRLGMWLGDDLLVGLLEAFPDDALRPARVELAFSTDPDWRRLGIARALYDAVAAQAWCAGARRLDLQCASYNRPMRALLRAIEADTTVDAGEVHAVCLAPATGLALNWR